MAAQGASGPHAHVPRDQALTSGNVRVLFDHQAFSLQARGGISRYFLELSGRLNARRDVEPRVVAGWHRNESLRESPASWVRGRYVGHISKTLPLRNKLNAWFTRREIRRWNPDVVHETYFQTRAHINPPTPRVITVYDLIYFALPEIDALAARTRAAQATAIRRAQHVICISEFTRRDLLRFIPIDPELVSVIPLASSLPESENTAAPQPPAIDGPYVLHVGLRNSYKNFDVVLQALSGSSLLKARFRLVAFGGGKFTPAEQVRFRELGLDPGRVVQRDGDDAVLRSYYAHAEAYICASLYEGFGLPVVEAMAQGCPVVCSNRGSLAEVSGSATLLFDPTQPAEVAGALEAIANSPVLAAKLREDGRRQASGFSWDRCADQTVAVYRELLR
jgi:glycosyltransferase involved in cell wall biosynthesis